MADIFDVAFPVNFVANGDTTKDAFGKHIQEIARIYGLLNALNTGKVSSSEVNNILKNHIDSTNPHPNYKPSLSFSDISGNLNINRVEGNLPVSRLSGNYPASSVSGSLTNATIPSGNVTGLDDKVKSLTDGLGIKESTLSKDGYVKFGNGLMIEWGTTTKKGHVGGTIETENFHHAFSQSCFALILTGVTGEGGRKSVGTPTVITDWVGATQFSYVVPESENSAFTYIAVGV